MWRVILIVLAVFFIGSAAVMWFAPQWWYDATPGVAMMGPFNLHFIRDVALAFLVSGGAIAWGYFKNDKTAMVFGALWPCLHAVFHIWIWAVMRGMPFDQIAAVNLLGIQLPAWAALLAACKFEPSP
ncbi:MAG: hypothetical protein ABJN69_15405 [Hellea sp.]